MLLWFAILTVEWTKAINSESIDHKEQLKVSFV